MIRNLIRNFIQQLWKMAGIEISDEARHLVMQDAFINSSLANVNGAINRLKKDEIRVQLKLLGLDDKGVKEVLVRRLKNYYKKKKSAKPKKNNDCDTQQGLDYFVVIDFEGTCEEENIVGYIHEIIEFPAVLVNARTLALEDKFHRYCRPLDKPILSEFCQNLTGITQKIVNDAQPFPDVLTEFNGWLKEHRLGTDRTFVIATDGPWDMGKFLPNQCTLSGISVPEYASKWVNVRKHYRRYYKPHEGMVLTLELMLEGLGMSFEGRPHSGIDDACNIAKMLVKMVQDGVDPRVNDDLAYQQRLAAQRSAKQK